MRLDLKVLIIILLCIMIFYLFVQIMSGTFCHCSTIQCPNNTDEMKGYLV